MATSDDYVRIGEQMTIWNDEKWAFGDPPAISKGSSLAADDVRCTGRKTSELVWLALASAREHMHAASLIWYSRPEGVTMPTAYGTILRTAVNGAANALWLLTGNRNERVGRTAAIIEEECRYILKAIDNALIAAPSLGINEAAVAHETKKRAVWDARRAEAVRSRTALSVKSFNQTAVIKWGGNYLLRDSPDGGALSVTTWQLASADAHALSWQRILRAAGNGRLDAATPSEHSEEMFEVRDIQDEDQLRLLVDFAALLERHASGIFNVRRQNHLDG